ncbi:MAG: hypothetical protein HY096_13475 [Nitrospinae bacterium]|nr:hypothetical protein [Nitrospinota bacterium]
MSIPAFAAQITTIPFWQNGGNVSTLISVVASNGQAAQGNYTSTGAAITITLTSTDTSAGYTIQPTSGTAAMTAGATFATATFLSYPGRSLQVDTAQIGGTNGTNIWSTGAAYSSTAARFGHGSINIGTSGATEHRGWVAVYGGTSPAGFTVDLGTF